MKVINQFKEYSPPQNSSVPFNNLQSITPQRQEVSTISTAHITLTLTQGIHSLITGAIEPTGTTYPTSQIRQSSVPLLLKPTPWRILPTTSLVQHLHPRYLREPSNLIQHVTPKKLNSCGHRLPTQLVYEDWKPAHTVIAIHIG
nr:hypothetical protein Iba_chr06aCG8290 [Ipomoea batatas]GME13009.1 hypothetical protein Iba_scaffold14324CG0090 [Ipomoea batatas]